MGIFTVNIITGSSSPKLIDIYILEAKCLTAFWKRTERPPIIQLLNNAFLFINGKICVPTGGKPSDVAAKDDGFSPPPILIWLNGVLTSFLPIIYTMWPNIPVPARQCPSAQSKVYEDKHNMAFQFWNGRNSVSCTDP